MTILCRSAFAAFAVFVAAVGPAQPAPQRPRILGISHVAFRVSDVAAARRFYGATLGLERREDGAKHDRRSSSGRSSTSSIEPGLTGS